MNHIARQLRAQIPASTDPARLERMARAAERRPSPAERAEMPGSVGQTQEPPRRPDGDIDRKVQLRALPEVEDAGLKRWYVVSASRIRSLG
jgi:hypothetical protein